MPRTSWLMKDVLTRILMVHLVILTYASTSRSPILKCGSMTPSNSNSSVFAVHKILAIRFWTHFCHECGTMKLKIGFWPALVSKGRTLRFNFAGVVDTPLNFSFPGAKWFKFVFSVKTDLSDARLSSKWWVYWSTAWISRLQSRQIFGPEQGHLQNTMGCNVCRPDPLRVFFVTVFSPQAQVEVACSTSMLVVREVFAVFAFVRMPAGIYPSPQFGRKLWRR